jgi:hypothetical protein
VRTRRRLTLAAMTLCGLMSVTAAEQQSASTSTAKPLPKAETRDRNLRAYVELLRSDLRTQKVALITQIMQFTEQEDAAFWPIYREYELELSRVNDDRLNLIERYATAYDKMTDAVANELMTKALDLESRRTGLKQKYFARLQDVISPRTAAKFIQVENQILLLLDLQVAASLPILQ